MSLQDSIEREVTLKASINKVWDAITNPEQLSQWFGDKADIPLLAENEPITFGWGDDICKGVIETVNPPTTFAFRWQSSRLGQSAEFQKSYSTLVTFTLTAIPTGTHLHMIERGFASLPDTIIDQAAVSSPNQQIGKVQVDTEKPLSMLTDPVQTSADDTEISMGSAETKLPHCEQAYRDNVSGWNHELNDLKAFIEQGK